MTVKDLLLKEIESLPESRQADVLAYVRFLKIGLAEPQEVAIHFAAALADLRKQAAARGITESDIEAEITAVRNRQ